MPFNRREIPCIHLGPTTGEEKECIVEEAKGRKIPTNFCALFGNCTVQERLIYQEAGYVLDVPFCQTCSHYQPDPEALSAKPSPPPEPKISVSQPVSSVRVGPIVSGPFPGVVIQRPGQAPEYLICPQPAIEKSAGVKASSGNCCCSTGITTPCCPNTLPTVLYMTGYTNCFPNTTTLTYTDPVSLNNCETNAATAGVTFPTGAWVGTATDSGAGASATVHLRCANDPPPHGPGLTWYLTFDGSGGGPTYCEDATSSWCVGEAVQSTCNPYHLSWYSSAGDYTVDVVS